MILLDWRTKRGWLGALSGIRKAISIVLSICSGAIVRATSRNFVSGKGSLPATLASCAIPGSGGEAPGTGPQGQYRVREDAHREGPAVGPLSELRPFRMIVCEQLTRAPENTGRQRRVPSQHMSEDAGTRSIQLQTCCDAF